MDTGAKTLAQLSEEGKEKKYVSMETASKISGYTKDYLERLCRLNQIEYRLWNNGQFVLELESLLRETHTILLSYEGITFVDKNELTDATVQEVAAILSAAMSEDSPEALARKAARAAIRSREATAMASGIALEIPRFVETNSTVKMDDDQPLAFIGRMVVSGVGADAEDEEEAPPQEAVTAKETHEPVRIAPLGPRTPEPAKTAPPQPAHSFHIPVVMDEEKTAGDAPPLKDEPTIHDSVEAKPVTPSSPVQDVPAENAQAAPEDNWDEMLLGETEEVRPLDPTAIENDEAKAVTKEEMAPQIQNETPLPPLVTVSKADVPSPYRPIKTSLDASEHHENDMPLFPFPMKVKEPIIEEKVAEKNVSQAEAPQMRSPSKAESEMSVPPASPSLLEIELGSAPAAASAQTPSEPPLRQRTIVFAPGMPEKIESKTASTPPVSEPASQRPLEVTPKETAPIARIESTPLPLVHPLPELAPEHHVSVRKDQALLNKSLVVAFAVVFVGSGSFLAAHFFPNGLGNDTNYVAGVGAALPPQQTNKTAEEETAHAGTLPFSDEVKVTPGATPNSVVIQRVYPSGEGEEHAFAIVPLDSTSTPK